MKALTDKKSEMTRIRARHSRFPKLEQVLLDWVRQQQSAEKVLGQREVQAFAKALSLDMEVTGFRASLGWMKGFTQRNGLSFLGRRETILNQKKAYPHLNSSQKAAPDAS
jgi:Tc5 transposase DNA-binding domain